MSDKCVHTEHCCVIHGCKYGQDDCPVINDIKIQSFPCEDCSEEIEYLELYQANKELQAEVQRLKSAIIEHRESEYNIGSIESQNLWALIAAGEDKE